MHAEPDLRLRVAPTPENGLQQWSFVMVDWPQTIRTEHMGEITPVRFAELEFSKHRVYIKDFDSSLLGRI
jgi:hypothetical protein